jgi:hypothetical protein
MDLLLENNMAYAIIANVMIWHKAEVCLREELLND